MGLFQFMPNEFVYYFVAHLMKEMDEFKEPIERQEKDVEDSKKEAKDVFKIMKNYGDKDQS